MGKNIGTKYYPTVVVDARDLALAVNGKDVKIRVYDFGQCGESELIRNNF